MREKIKNAFYSWLYPALFEKEQRRVEMEAAVRKHWPEYEPIHLHELIREVWEEEVAEGKDSRFIVFIDKDIGIDWITAQSTSPEVSKAISYAESIGAKECKQLPESHQLEFQRLVGQAIACAIEGNLDISKQTADWALKSLSERTAERSRMWTLLYATIGYGMFITVFWLVWLQLDSFDLARWSVFGGVSGAYLSVIQNAGKGKWNSAAGVWVHIVEITSRLVSGCVLGGVSYAIIQSPLSPKLFNPQDAAIWQFSLFGTMAGFVERLIPRMLSSCDNLNKEIK